MRRILAALALLSLLPAVPALAEKAATGATVPKAGAAPAAGRPADRAGINQAEMIKAQKASAARDKAWDARTRNSMSSICKGC